MEAEARPGELELTVPKTLRPLFRAVSGEQARARRRGARGLQKPLPSGRTRPWTQCLLLRGEEEDTCVFTIGDRRLAVAGPLGCRGATSGRGLPRGMPRRDRR